MVEHQLPKLRVAGSSPVPRSTERPANRGLVWLSLPGEAAASRSLPDDRYLDGIDRVSLDEGQRETCASLCPIVSSLLLSDLTDALLDLLARLPGLLLNLVHDLVRVVATFLNVPVCQFVELLDKLRLEVTDPFL